VAERLQRYLARAGVASRRHAEALITAGRVAVNNQVVTTLGSKVEPGDLVAVDGKLVSPPEHVSWFLLYKPAGVVTTLDDPLGRPTVRKFLGGVRTRVFPIGRLDWDAEGALLLTDDGATAHRLLHPSFQVHRTYLAKVRGVPAQETLARLVEGVRLEDGPARAVEAVPFQPAERNTWLRITVAEGRPHLVKRLCAAIGHPVVRLYRPHQAGVSVAGMQPGELRPLRPEELRTVEAVAAGQPIPPLMLSLPPRRHGRADGDDGEARLASARVGTPAFSGRVSVPGSRPRRPGERPRRGPQPASRRFGGERRAGGTGRRGHPGAPAGAGEGGRPTRPGARSEQSSGGRRWPERRRGSPADPSGHGRFVSRGGRRGAERGHSGSGQSPERRSPRPQRGGPDAGRQSSGAPRRPWSGPPAGRTHRGAEQRPRREGQFSSQRISRPRGGGRRGGTPGPRGGRPRGPRR
jgi:23S rRNA pseudouridine2605 synthase